MLLAQMSGQQDQPILKRGQVPDTRLHRPTELCNLGIAQLNAGEVPFGVAHDQGLRTGPGQRDAAHFEGDPQELLAAHQIPDRHALVTNRCGERAAVG